jgi:hypothetical protein
MERESGGISVWVWVIGGLVLVCGVVGMIACLFLAALFLGVNPLGPVVYDLF